MGSVKGGMRTISLMAQNTLVAKDVMDLAKSDAG
jgi:hypothetical protein